MITPQERLRLLARLFTRPVFADLGRHGNGEKSFAFLRPYQLLADGPERTVASLFEAAWRELRRKYRSEYVYKNEVANRILFGLHKPHQAALHVELPIGRSIVDVAVYNGTSTAYEIKTEFDSARRIKTQTENYLRAFNEVHIVAYEPFVAALAREVSSQVGILVLSADGKLDRVRDAIPDHSRLRHDYLFRALRRSEYVEVIETASGEKLDVPSGRIARSCAAAFREIDISAAHEIYVRYLRQRKTDSETIRFLTSLPKSLRALGCATPLSRPQQSRILQALNQRLAYSIR